MRPRNVLLVLVINYFLILMVSFILEIRAVSATADHVKQVMHEAADITLQQTQTVDDFMAYEGRDSYKVLAPASDGSGFELTDLYGKIFGLDSTDDNNKEKIFNRLYVDGESGNDFRMLADRTGAVTKPVKFYDRIPDGVTTPNYVWYYMPTISWIGTDVLPSGTLATKVKNASGGYADGNISNAMYSAYGLNSHTKITKDDEEYYNTPISMGITYLNEDLTARLFSLNMDLVMRQKYDGNYDLNSEEGGNGLLRGYSYSGRGGSGAHHTRTIDTTSLTQYNPINDGEFTYLRGTEASDTSGTYTGVKPTIVYKVIDMYDSQNDALLVSLFGAKKGAFGSKAQYLKSLDQDIINPVTGAPYTKKPIVVAKVTFYADVVIPYTTPALREIISDMRPELHNYMDIKDDAKAGEGGTRRISYTRFFAVTP